jgi:hypothetical protein
MKNTNITFIDSQLFSFITVLILFYSWSSKVPAVLLGGGANFTVQTSSPVLETRIFVWDCTLLRNLLAERTKILVLALFFYVQTGSGAHPGPCQMGIGGPFPGGKARPERNADHSPHLVPRS